MPRQGLTWLFWLAMLLPLAQTAASWHAYSHARPEVVEQDDDRNAPHAAHCDLCLTAAVVTGGALTGQPDSLPLQALGHALPSHTAAQAWLATLALGYLSRAPPLFAH